MDQFVDCAGAKIWTTRNGHGVPMLLFNGGPGCSDYLEPVSQMLESRCSMVRFEARGCGRSSWVGPYDWETTVEDAERIRVAYGLSKWIVGGHSFGPDLALAYTIKYPQNVLGIIGISGGRIVNDRDWSTAYHKGREEIGEDIGGAIFTADPKVNSVGNSTWREYIKNPMLLRDISKISVPCYFINASKDIRPTWPTRQIANLVPKGKYFEIEGAGHYIWLTHSKQLEAQLSAAVDFITL